MTSDRDRLIELFKKTEYTPFPEMTMTANLGNQFTDYGLNCIVDNLLANGVIVSPLKLGDKIYRIFSNKIVKIEVSDIEIEFRNFVKKKYRYNYNAFTNEDFGETVFLTKEEAEKALKEREG